MTFPEHEESAGSEVKIRNRAAWPEGTYRTGYLYKRIGALDEQTRLVRALAVIPDPLARNSPDLPPLIIGAFVEAEVQGNAIENAIRLNRDYVRQDNTVWVMKEERLRIREVNIVFSDSEYAYISDGLNEGDSVVTTNLTTVTDGARLRVGDQGNGNNSPNELQGGAR